MISSGSRTEIGDGKRKAVVAVGEIRILVGGGVRLGGARSRKGEYWNRRRKIESKCRRRTGWEEKKEKRKMRVGNKMEKKERI